MACRECDGSGLVPQRHGFDLPCPLLGSQRDHPERFPPIKSNSEPVNWFEVWDESAPEWIKKIFRFIWIVLLSMSILLLTLGLGIKILEWIGIL